MSNRKRRSRRRRRGYGPPDILYHATTTKRVDQVRSRGRLELSGDRKVYLSDEEADAWHVAHRLSGEPAVLYVDVSRARRDGVSFERGGPRMWKARSVEIRHVLNLRKGFAEQVSAGGIPVWWAQDGPQLALIKVTRRSGTTWEVAKGKMEPGETPAQTAVREVQEEMGVSTDFDVVHPLGFVRYGFHTPGGYPRLKTMHMYLIKPHVAPTDFQPSLREGIKEVAWFSPEEAANIVTHRSLRPLMARVRDLLTGDDVRLVDPAMSEE